MLAIHTHLWVGGTGPLRKETRVSHKEAAVGGAGSNLSCSSGPFFVILMTRVTYFLLAFFLLVDILLRSTAPQAANSPSLVRLDGLLSTVSVRVFAA